MNVPAAAAAEALHAQRPNAAALPAELDVATDTRTLKAGQTYLALRGENFDGHDFVEAAVRAGAACLIVDRPIPSAETVPVLLVADTKAAYMQLAGLARAAWAGPVVAITGSTGKTTTKTFLLQMLEHAGRDVAATPANENNEIGVSKFFLREPSVPGRIGIVEMGARHFGDISVLVDVARPDIGVLTNIGEAHLEVMGSRERLANTKWGLFSRGAHAVINLDDVLSRKKESSLKQPPTYFGTRTASPQPGGRSVIVRDRTAIGFYEGTRGQFERADIRVPGEHNLLNVAAAAAAAYALGVTPAEIARAAGALVLPHGRYERMDVAGIGVVYDAYNASLSGSLATFEAFAAEPASRRIVVFGSMAELGPAAGEMHERAGERVARLGFDVLLVGGDYAADTARGAANAGLAANRIVPYVDNAAAVAWLRTHARAGDAVLIKGSRKYQMEQIVQGLETA